MIDLSGKTALITGSVQGIGLAIAKAFEEGKLGVFDYYNLRNIQADTGMRDSIADGDKNKSSDDS